MEGGAEALQLRQESIEVLLELRDRDRALDPRGLGLYNLIAETMRVRDTHSCKSASACTQQSMSHPS